MKLGIQDVLDGEPQWQVIHGDCLEVMPRLGDRSVDHVITDPPYGEHVHSKQRRGGRLVNEIGSFYRAADLGFDAITDEVLSAAAVGFAGLSRRWALTFCNAELASKWLAALEAAGMRHVRVGAWVKLNATPQFTGDRPGTGFETIEIAHARGARTRWNGGGLPGVWQHAVMVGRPQEDQRAHTTQKPLSLMLELVELFTDPGELILDPFCGSGTTGVACLRLGRRFIGIEKDEKYAAIATERLKAEQRGLSLREARAGQLSIQDILGSTSIRR